MRVFTVAAVAALGLALCQASAAAQLGVEPGDAGVSFDALGTTAGLTGVIAFLPFDLYVVSHAVPDGMEGYEFSLIPPAGMLVSAGRILPAGATDSGDGEDNWIVGTGGVCQGAVGAFVMVKYGGALFLSTPGVNTPICLAGATPSSVPGGVAGYRACASSGDPRAFGVILDGCALLNAYQGSSPADAADWGELKARFDR